MSSPGKRRDLGRVAKLRCPHCHEVTFYHLHEGRRSDELYLQCVDCNYDAYVDSSENEVAHRLVELGRAFASGKISASEHAEALAKAPVEALKQLLAEGKINSCPSCGEEVPAYFECCWNCGGEVAATAEISGSGTDAIGFPDPIFGATPLIDHEREK